MSKSAVQWPTIDMPGPDPFFNPRSPEVFADPFPAYRRLYQNDPVYWHEQLQAWVITSHPDASRILKDSDSFSADFRKIGIPTPPTLLSLQTLDPPEQTPLRHLGLDMMRALDYERLETAALDMLRSRLVPLLERGGTFDFITDFADEFTMDIITAVLGVSPPTEDEISQEANRQVDASMDAGVDNSLEGPGLSARAAFNAIVRRWFSNPPASGAIAYLYEHRHEARVTDEVLINSVRAFFHAGYEVPSRFLGNACLALAQHPDDCALILNGRVPVDVALEELIRFAGPVQALSRACTVATELGEHQIEAGQLVTTLIAAANRDPRTFNEPDRLNLARKPNPHLGFGRGAHSCLGAAIGRLQGRALLTVLAEQQCSIALAGDATFHPSATLRGPSHLPLEPR